METMEGEMKKLPEVDYSLADCSTLREWVVKDWPNPSFWSSDEQKASTDTNRSCGDIFFDGIEIEAESSGEIMEIGGLPYLLDKKRSHNVKLLWPNGKCATVKLKGFEIGETLYLDDNGNQDVLFDRATKIGKWTYDKSCNSDEIVIIATNVAIGVMRGKLHEIWFRYNGGERKARSTL